MIFDLADDAILRYSGEELSLAQYMLLDVLAILALLALVLLLLAAVTFRQLYKCIRSKKHGPDVKKVKNE